jgi:hypothetical protein
VEIGVAAGSAGLERENGFSAMSPTAAGANRGGRRSGGIERLPGKTGAAGKQQAGNLDLATVAWKQAVVAGERKAVATSRS